MSIIYRIYNNITKKSYIGQTKFNLNIRWSQYKKYSKKLNT